MFGQREAAHDWLARSHEVARTEKVPTTMFAQIHAPLGEVDEAMEWLERAYAERDPWLVWLKVNPCFDRIRTDPRFIAMVRRVGLEP